VATNASYTMPGDAIKTRQQRCWVHKTANVLNALPKSLHTKAKQDLHAIYEAESLVWLCPGLVDTENAVA